MLKSLYYVGAMSGIQTCSFTTYTLSLKIDQCHFKQQQNVFYNAIIVVVVVVVVVVAGIPHDVVVAVNAILYVLF